MHRAIVIGAGIGGIAAAIRLQAAGYHVLLVEGRDQPGGRAGALQLGHYRFDMGPTLITAPDLLRELWALTDRELERDVVLSPLSPFYRIVFADGRTFDYWGDPERDEAEIARIAPSDVKGYRAFLHATRRIYQRAFAELAGEPFDHLTTFLRIVPELLQLRAHESVYRFASRYFQSPELRIVFSFHPLFIGGNPLRASAIYSIVPYLERQGGVWFAHGGIQALVHAMVERFQALGGEVLLNAPVKQIIVRNGRIHGVQLADTTIIPADIVVANSDVTKTWLQLIPPDARPWWTWRLPRLRYSMSCFLLYLGLKHRFPQLERHTIMMPADYTGLLAQLFDGTTQLSELAFYLHAPATTDPSFAPAGQESLYILVPVPHLGHLPLDWAAEAPAFRARILTTLEYVYGLQGIANAIMTEAQFTPTDFATQLQSWHGAAFSIEPTLTQSAYFRPHNRVRTIQGLYFVGAGTHPGAGIPGVLLSAAITSRLVQQDWPAPRSFRLSSPLPTGSQRAYGK